MNKHTKLKVPYALSVHGREEEEAVAKVIREHRTSLGIETRAFEKKVAALFGKKYGVMVNSGSSANKYKLSLIEDSCDTLGAEFKDKPTGAFSDISTTSFYGSHVINAGGGGGMILVNRRDWYRRLLVLRGWGRSSGLFSESEDVGKRFTKKLAGVPYDGKFFFTEVGYNFLPLEMGSAFGLAQLKKLPRFAKRRRDNFQELLMFFKKWNKFFELPRQTPESRTSWLAFPLTIRSQAPFSRLEIVKFLEKRNIQTRPIFTGNVLRQPAFKRLAVKNLERKYPAAERIMKNSFLVGCHQGLGGRHLAYLKNAFNEFLGRF